MKKRLIIPVTLRTVARPSGRSIKTPVSLHGMKAVPHENGSAALPDYAYSVLRRRSQKNGYSMASRHKVL